MLTKKILKAVLNVKHTAIDDMKILPDGSFAVMAHPTKGEQCRCGICGRKSTYYDNGRGSRSWRTCDWNTNKVYIIADEPRVDCPEHGVVTDAVPWARHKSRFTKEFEELATWLAMNCSKTAEYSRAAEPPVRCCGSQSTGSCEPPEILCRKRLFTRVGI